MDAPRPQHSFKRARDETARGQADGRWAGISVGAGLGLALLLVGPVAAGLRLAEQWDGRWLAGGAVAVSAWTFGLYWRDKRRAQTGRWRTPEATLHLAGLAGGWPGAFLAQRALRHKVSKASFQAEFWLVVGVHQWAAFDFLQDWRWTRAGFGLLKWLAR